ncbi:CACNA1B [Symbiodinium microadriaticum]|nr:CACNA1B [Symbiodinium microadriaticum]
MAPFLVKEISFSTAELPRTWPAFRLSSCFYKEGLRILQLTWLAAEVSGLHACVCLRVACASRLQELRGFLFRCPQMSRSSLYSPMWLLFSN